jgi:drug/metabolite transporter (DMT)-like permease
MTDGQFLDVSPYHPATSKQVTGYVICLVSALITVTYMHVVKYKLQNLNLFVYNFWAAIFGLVTSFCIMAATEEPVLPSISLCIIMLLVTILFAGSYGICDYRAYQLLDPVIVALIHTLQIALTFGLQYTILTRINPGHANVLEICGALLIFVGNALIPAYVLIQFRLKKKRRLLM